MKVCDSSDIYVCEFKMDKNKNIPAETPQKNVTKPTPKTGIKNKSEFKTKNNVKSKEFKNLN